MKKIISLVLAVAFCLSAFCQGSDWKRRYDNLVSAVGLSGVGVETFLANWEKADSNSVDFLKAKSDFFYSKAKTSEFVSKYEKKYLGRTPAFELKDSTGTPLYYYQDSFFDDALLAESFKYLDRAIASSPQSLDLRIDKVNTLLEYEKDSPDMVLSELISMIEENAGGHKWQYGGEESSDEIFNQVIQEYAVNFYQTASPSSLEAFKSVSEKMLSYYPARVEYIDNIAAYYIAKKDIKTALKYYNKALKIKPDDMNAIRNCVNVALREKNVKLQKKYLPMMEKYGTEAEKIQARAKLSAL